MSKNMKDKIEISEEEIKKAHQSANHSANFKFNTVWGPVAIRVVALGQLAPFSQNKPEKIEENGVVRGDDHWLENFAKAGLLETETRAGFIKRVKSLRVDAPILNLDN